jgi:hypothetical protein
MMEELDRLRSARNAISHSWNIDSLKDFFTKGRLADMHRMEEVLAERKDLTEELSPGFEPLAAFRCSVDRTAFLLSNETEIEESHEENGMDNGARAADLRCLG